MKTKSIVIIVIIITLSGISTYLLQPKSIAKNIDLLDVHRVVHNLGNEERTVITEKIDLDLLKSLISRYKCSRTPHSFAPYQQQTVRYEIDGTYDNKPLHIILGDINVIYESGDKGGFKIRNSEKLIEEVIALIQHNN